MTCAWDRYGIVEKTKVVHVKTSTWQEVVLLLDTCCSRTCSKFSWPAPSGVWKLKCLRGCLSFYKCFRTCAINIYSSLVSIKRIKSFSTDAVTHAAQTTSALATTFRPQVQLHILIALIPLSARVHTFITFPLGFTQQHNQDINEALCYLKSWLHTKLGVSWEVKLELLSCSAWYVSWSQAWLFWPLLMSRMDCWLRF